MAERIVIGDNDPWPDAISDGLVLSCFYCEVVPVVDYRVTDEAWAEVFGDYEARLGVVCIDCFAGLLDVPVASVLVDVQIAHRGQTLVLKPERVYEYEVGGDS